MRQICVFCGSSLGASPEYVEAARRLGRAIAERGIGLVYGGAGVGAMREIADAVLEHGGRVTGVITRALFEKQVAHPSLPDLRVVDSMHERKALMAELADEFIALPGGYGTIEEFFEALTWAQLGIHAKPCGLLNVGQYYDRLVEFLEHAAGQRFIREEHLGMMLVDRDPEALLDRMDSYQAPKVDKWLDRKARQGI